jgi:hypothetical protein
VNINITKRNWFFKWLRSKLGVDSLAGEVYVVQTRLNEQVLREKKDSSNPLSQPSLYERVKQLESDIDIYGSGIDLAKIVRAIIEYLDVRIDRGMEVDTNYPPPEPRVRPYLRLKRPPSFDASPKKSRKP